MTKNTWLLILLLRILLRVTSDNGLNLQSTTLNTNNYLFYSFPFILRHKPVLDFIETGEEHEVHLNGNHIHHHQVCLHFIITFFVCSYFLQNFFILFL